MKIISTILSLFFVSMSIAGDYDSVAEETYRKEANTLTLQIIPSTYPLVWEKPWEIIFSVLKNKYYFPITTSTLGHVTAEINCTIEGVRKQKFIGQTVKDLLGYTEKIKEGYGFSILNHPRLYSDIPFLTIDGALDNKDRMYKKYNELIKKNHFGALSFVISEQDCIKTIEFAKEYEEKTESTKLAGNRYGFGADTLKFEGAGCATMAEALLLKAGLKNFSKLFERTVFISPKLIGNPKKGKKVGVWDIIKETHDMRNPKEGYLKFVFPDPQLMYDHLLKLTNSKNIIVTTFGDSSAKIALIRP